MKDNLVITPKIEWWLVHNDDLILAKKKSITKLNIETDITGLKIYRIENLVLIKTYENKQLLIFDSNDEYQFKKSYECIL